MPFGWTEGQAQAWAAIAQVVLAIVVVILTAAVTIHAFRQSEQAAKMERKRLAEERIADAGILAIEPSWTHTTRRGLLPHIVVTNRNPGYALSVYLSVVEASGDHNSEEHSFGDIPPGEHRVWEFDGSAFASGKRDENGQLVGPFFASTHLVLTLSSARLRGQSVEQVWEWMPDKPNAEYVLYQATITIHSGVKGEPPSVISG